MERHDLYKRFAHEIYAKLVLAGMSAEHQSPKEFSELPFYEAASLIGNNLTFEELETMLRKLEETHQSLET